MAIKVNGTTVIDDSRNATFTEATISGATNFTGTDSLSVPSGTTAERPTSPAAGYIRYNTDISELEQYDGSSWINVGGGEVQKASLTKSFGENEQVSISLSSSTPTASVSVVKEIPQIGVTNNDFDVAADGSNFTLHDTAYDTSLVLSSTTDDGAFALGAGSFAPTDVGKRIVGGGGEAVLINADGSYRLNTPFNSSTISAGQWSMFALDTESDNLGLTLSNAVPEPYDVTAAIYTGVSGPSTGQSRDVGFRPDGTRMYVGNGNFSSSQLGVIVQYNLSTPWDITQAVSEFSFVTSDEPNAPEVGPCFDFKPDGTRLFYAGQTTEAVNQFNLSTPWELDTASYSDSYNLGIDNPTGIFFRPNGSEMFVCDRDTERVYKYSLSTAWNINTASSSGSFDPNINFSALQDILFNPSGENLYLLDGAGTFFYKFQLSTPWDISTASLSSSLEITAGNQDWGSGFDFKSDGTKLYMTDYFGNQVFEYALGIQLPYSQYTTGITTTSIDTEFWTNINSMKPNDAVNDGEIYYALSNDDRTTWKITDRINGERSIVRNNSGTWEINDSTDYNTETWISATTNDEFFALQEAVKSDTAQGSTTYNIENATYTNNSFDVSNESTAPGGIFFKPDGTRMYVLDYGSDIVFEYNLSTPWDITTAGYSRESTPLTNEDGTPFELHFKTDGTKMYIAGLDSDSILEYDLSTAWDITTASYSGNSFFTAGESSPRGLFFRDDGLRMYFVGTDTDAVFEVVLSTPWDITTASYSGNIFDGLFSPGSPGSIFFRPNGFTMYVTDYGSDIIKEYFLSVPWDVSTAVYSGISLDLSEQDGTPFSFFFKSDGTRLYMLGASNDAVFEYDTEAVKLLNRMSPAQLSSTLNSNQFTPGNDLDLAITMYMENSESLSIPTSDGVSINYDANVLNQLAVLGTDYEYDQPDNTTVRVKSMNAEKLKIRVV